MTVKTINYTNWSTEVFPGFYESELYNSDTIYNINEALDDGDPAMDFTDNGFTEYCDDVARQAAEALADALDQDDKIIVASRFKKLHSPRFYNFETDKIEMDLDVDWEALVEWVKSESYAFNEYLKSNFTSYDGFVSFVPNNTRDFWDKFDSDADRLTDVLIEFYIINHLDRDWWRDSLYEIATNTIWQYLAPVEETENPDQKTENLK
jgi:hypothetical protein